MHLIKNVEYLNRYKLLLTFEDNSIKSVDLKDHLDGEIFTPLKDSEYFKTVSLNTDIDTIVWKNGADFSPDFLYEIGIEESKVAY